MRKSSSAPVRSDTAGRSAPVRRDDALVLLGWLTHRDRMLLDVLAEHQVLTTPQIAQLAFPSLDRAQHRLNRLYRLGVLDRFRWHVPAGSISWHYTLGTHGAALVAAGRGTDPPRPAELRRRITRLAASPRLAHTVGLNGFFTALAAHARAEPGAALAAWWSEGRCAGHYGQIVRPDGYGAWNEDGRRVEFFLEFDTGTESLGRLVAELSDYTDLAVAGGPAHVVLFWLPSPRREANLQRLLDQASLPAPVATAAAEFADSLGVGPAGSVWLIPGSERRQRLIDVDRSAHGAGRPEA